MAGDGAVRSGERQGSGCGRQGGQEGPRKDEGGESATQGSWRHAIHSLEAGLGTAALPPEPVSSEVGCLKDAEQPVKDPSPSLPALRRGRPPPSPGSKLAPGSGWKGRAEL